MSSWKDKYEVRERDWYIVWAIAIAGWGYDFFIEEIPRTTYLFIIVFLGLFILVRWVDRLKKMALEAEARIKELEWKMDDTRRNYEQKDLEPIRFEDDSDYDPDTD